MRRFKNSRYLPVLILLFCGFLATACGTSSGKLELSNFLQKYETLINDFKVAYDASDQQKKAQLASEINAMMAQWVEKRNEMNDEVTPQAMDELVKEYNRITAKFNGFNKTG